MKPSIWLTPRLPGLEKLEGNSATRQLRVVIHMQRLPRNPETNLPKRPRGGFGRLRQLPGNLCLGILTGGVHQSGALELLPMD